MANFVTLDMRLQAILEHDVKDQELSEGCSLTHRLLLSVLQKHGVEIFSPEVGDFFDKEIHDTVDA